jgi:hypothetical protein
MDLIAEFCLNFILLKISTNFVYLVDYTSYMFFYINCRCFFINKNRSVQKNSRFSYLGRKVPEISFNKNFLLFF